MTDREKIREWVKARLDENASKQSLPQFYGMMEEDARFLDFLDSIQEEPVSEELEEAAKRYATEGDEISGLHIIDEEVDAFIAGAKWKEEQFEKNRLEHCNSITNEQAELEQGFIDQHLDKNDRMPTFLDAIEYGMRLQKEQTMGNNYTKKTLLTMKEYEAIVWAYATLQCEVGNNTLPEYSVKEAKAVIDIIDEFTERVQKQRLIE